MLLWGCLCVWVDGVNPCGGAVGAGLICAVGLWEWG